ncbi:MAG TPA: dienelactone hydrolase family protein [Prosthecobacter sp.]|jgi:dienelactone hydrolase|nr:dienelactone hydrolase family protein [Prosthecobacter sp.]
MKTNRALIFISSLFLFTSLLRAEIKETIVEYQSGNVTCEGLHVVDTARAGRLPAVLIIHQWTGLSDNEKMRAHMLAQLGYNVFSADVYGKGVRPQPPAAGQEAMKYKSNRKLYRERMLSALEVLNKDEHTDPAKIAAIGYCFGGTGVIELARSGALVKGVVSFHGGLDSPSPADGKNIKGKVLALHGADDPFVPAKDIAAFEQEMKDAKVDYKLVSYPGAVHAFTQKAAGNDNSKGAAYNEAADKASWEEMKAFFARIFNANG